MNFIIILFFSQLCFSESFIPKNTLHLDKESFAQGGITEVQFNQVIDKVEKIYSSVVTDAGANLIMNRKWKDNTVNASAEQKGKDWHVNMFGGLAKFRTITVDGFTLVLCHELGHHIGGSPKYKERLTWATNEGQADYWGTIKCLRRVWDLENNEEAIKPLKVSKFLASRCVQEWKTTQEQALCIRTGQAGNSVAGLFSALGRTPPPWFERPDQSEVEETNDLHPRAQCRLDTYFQGALCEKTFKEDTSFESEVTGTCHRLNGDTKGLRPACWFKSN